jgi:autotransporter-associated beta strand protein
MRARASRWFDRHCARPLLHALSAILALSAPSALAAITFDAASSASGANPSSVVSWSHTVGAGDNRMLVVGVAAERNADQFPTSVTFGSQSLTKVTGSSASQGTPYNVTELWYLPAPAVGMATITITFPSSQANGGECGAVSLFGVKDAAPEAVAIANAAGSGGSYSLAITTLSHGAWLVDVVNNGTGGTTDFVAGAEQMERWDRNAGGQMRGACSTREVWSAGLVTDTWTATGGSSRKAHSIAAFAPAPAPLAVSITSPAGGTTVAADFTISASASVVPGTVDSVDFYMDDVPKGNDTTYPYSWDVTGAALGGHTLKAVANGTGGTATSAVVNINVVANAGFGALSFDGVDDYVTMGTATGLGAPTFTLECWVKHDPSGTGRATANSGTGGVNIYPLIGKGRGEGDGSNVDCNYTFGLQTDGRLAADFEDYNNGLNHPIVGTNVVPSNVWKHCAITYDGSYWKIYIDGALDNSLQITGGGNIQVPRYDSIQHFGLGTAMTSAGAVQGFYKGLMDEVRVWNYARSQTQIANSMYSEIATATGLLGRWSLNAASGTTATNTGSSAINGTLTNGPAWVTGYPLQPAANQPPTVAITSPANSATVFTDFTITATATDSDGSIARVTFYDGATEIGTDTSSPYSCAWTGAPTGSHSLTAVALDNGGLTSVSAVVNVTVSTNVAPAAPVTVAPSNGATGVATSVTPTVTVSDPNGDAMTVTFYGRANAIPAPGPDFTLVALPDTQFYSETYTTILPAQTTWIVNNRVARNIVYVTGEGDVVNSPSAGQYDVATAAYAILENPTTTGLAQGIPFGVPVGNHDSYDSPSYTLFNTYFPTTRFSGRDYYGGSYTSGYRNHYDLFSAGGLDFIVLSLEYNASAAVLTWANGILAANPTRRAIVVTHSLLQAGTAWPNPAPWSTDGGTAIFPALSGNANLFLMLCGHNHGTGRRHEPVGSRYIDVLLADYQSETNGGNGFLRTLEFSPANNVIRLKTYSPTTSGSKTDGDNEFTLDYNMSATPPAFTVIGTASSVASGAQASVSWTGLTVGTTYEWYAVASDGSLSTPGTTHTFTTQGVAPQRPTVAITSPANGASVVTNFTINATAADSDGTITSVKFYDGATLLGTDTSSPYSFEWTGALEGNHALTAEALDNSGLTTVSAVVNVIVGPPDATWIQDGSGLWSTGTHWLAGLVPDGNGSIARMHTIDITADRSVSLDTARTVGSMFFGDTNLASAAGWTLNNNGSAANRLTLAGTTPTITVNTLGTDKTATISAEILAAAGLTKAGAGTLVLAANNLYTGPTLVNAGLLKTGVASVPNTSGAFGNNSAITLADGAGAALDITGFDTQIGSLAGGGGNGGNVTLGTNALTVGGDNTSTAYAGVIASSAGVTGTSLRKIGSGRLTLQRQNTYTGKTVIEGGTLYADESNGSLADAKLGTVPASFQADNIIIRNGGTLLLASGTDGRSLSVNRGIYLDTGTQTINTGSGDFYVNGVISGPGGLFHGDGGLGGYRRLYLNAANTFTGDTRWDASGSTNNYGGIEMVNPLALQNSALDTSSVGSFLGYGGTTLSLGGLINSGNFTVGAAITNLTLNPTLAGVTKTYSGILSGATGMSLTKTGAGTQVLSGANTYTGNTIVQEGTLSITQAYLADTSTIKVGTVPGAAAVLDLNHALTDTVAALYIDGVQMLAGTYGSSTSTATNKDASAFLGAGVLNVLSGPSSLITLLSENFDSMGSAGTTLPAGWTAGYLGAVGSQNRLVMAPYAGDGLAITPMPVVVSAGAAVSPDVGTVLNLGSAGSSERALGGYPRTSPSGDQIMQVAIVNTTGSPLTTVSVSYAGEQWRQFQGTSSSGPEMLRVLASTTSPTTGFTYFSSLDFTAPQQGAGGTALDGNLAANRAVITGTITFDNPVAAGGTFYLRWHDWNDNGTSDHFLGIDDVVVSSIAAGPPPPSVTLGVTGSPLAEAGGTATVTATLSAAHTLPVTVNLAYTGTATLTTDYTPSANSIGIAAGNTTGSVTLTAVQDSVYENPNETIVVDIASVANGTESGTQTVTATITDDDAAPAKRADYVIVISVDGMGSEYVKPLLTPGLTNELTNFKRFQTEGSGTLNARDDYNYAVTLPNHVTMMTSRGVNGTTGHNWISNSDPGATATLETNKGSYVASGFDVAHDNGLRTGIWSGKSKFSLFQQSYSATAGAVDTTGADNGRDKIDYDKVVASISASALTTDFTTQMAASPYHYIFFHYQDPDATGHGSGWSTDPNSAFAATLKAVDIQIGVIMQMITNSPTLNGRSVIIITADHGGHGTTHGDTTNYLDYTIPFYVWGPGIVTAGSDLYAMNPASRTEPGARVNPPYTGGQPVRNGDCANLALNLLGLGPVPGSTIDSTQDLVVTAPVTLPTVTLALSGSPLAENAGTATVSATLSAPHSLPVTVNLAFAGTATLTADYTRSGTSILIPAGSTSGSITLTSVPDTVRETPNETIVVDIGTVENATESGTQQVTATITDADPFTSWISSNHPDLTGSEAAPGADPDGDGMTNQQEFAFGLDPSDGASVNPITMPLEISTGRFKYIRRATPATTGLVYTVLTTTDMVTWSPDPSATQNQTPEETIDGVQTVSVTLTTPALNGKLFVRVEAAPAP